MSRVATLRGDGIRNLRLIRRPLPTLGGLDRAREILVLQQRAGANQHRPSQEYSSSARSESPVERNSRTTGRMSTQLLVDAENNVFDESVGAGGRTWKGRGPLAT